MHEQGVSELSAFNADKIHLSSIRTFSRFKFAVNHLESKKILPKFTDEPAVETELSKKSAEMKRTLDSVADHSSRHHNKTQISETEPAEDDEPLDSLSEGSSDGYSVDSDGKSCKNDQNTGERLLPLKRLKKGFTSSKREIHKQSDWTEHIMPYDHIISVAFDHANYTRLPPNFVDVNRLQQLASKASLPEAVDEISTSAVELAEHTTLQSSAVAMVNLPLDEKDEGSCTFMSDIDSKVSRQQVPASLSMEKLVVTLIDNKKDDLYSEGEAVTVEKNVQESKPCANDIKGQVNQPKTVVNTVQKTTLSPKKTVNEPKSDIKESEESVNLVLEIVKEPPKSNMEPLRNAERPKKVVNFAQKTSQAPLQIHSVDKPVDETPNTVKKTEKSSEVKIENEMDKMEVQSEPEDEDNDNSSSSCQVRKPRGRPKGRKNYELPIRRSYRNVFGRLRMRSNMFEGKVLREKTLKRPVGRPRKYPVIEMSIEKLPKSVNEDKQLKLTATRQAVSINLENKMAKENQMEVLTQNREIVVRKDEQLVAEKVDTQVKDRLMCISSTETLKRPKGRPRLYPITMQINKEMDQYGKRKRNKAINFQRTLLQCLSDRSRSNEVNAKLESEKTAEVGHDKNENSDLSKEAESPSPNPACSSNSGNGTSDASITPNHLFTQISKRSSLRQVECAFRFREVVVKRFENFLHIVLTSNTRVKNGLNCQVLHELKTALMSAKNDNRCNCVMLSGTGGVFCSGVDLISLSNDKTKATADKLSTAIRDFCKSLMTFTKPLVAAVNGSAVGLGVSMLPYFDLVYATDKATFYSPYAKLGQVPEGGATFLLPTVMGYARANGLLIEGRKLTATEAYDCGIVTQVLWPATFMEEVMPRVQALANRPSQALESTKALVRFHALNKLEVTLDTECRLLHQYWSSDECRQSIKHFLENEEVV
ncbi:hypothetical protein CHUAL_003692 [Chamberlinius hualienensis]